MNEQANEAFDEMLDECYEPYKIGKLTFWASDILRECDPVAYRIGVSEYEDYVEENADDEGDDDE